MYTAHAFTHCIHNGCKAGAGCLSAEALKLASYTHMWQVLDRIATKRATIDPTTLNPAKASAEQMRAVANELKAMLHELNTEFQLRAAVSSGEAADC